MPELPEVEEAAQRLRAVAVGKVIVAAVAHHPSQRRQFPRRHAVRVEGQSLAVVDRRGKHQLLVFANGAVLHVHFRMDGDWAFTRAAAPLPRHARFSIDLADGMRASLTDPRALCTVRFHAPGSPPELDLGPEADDPALTAAALRAALGTRRGAIKPVLLDQRLIAGVGNVYASGALWRARLHPALGASSLGPARVARLLAAIRASLADGVVNAGRYRSGVRTIPLSVYDREGEPCARCASTIRRLVQSGRSTFYCPACQRR